MQKLATEDAPSASPVTVRMLGALSTIAGLLTVAMLHLGRDVLVPFALAVLLGFVLDPLVTWLRRRGLPCGASVALVTLFTVGLLGATSLFVGSQAVQLSKDLPTYQSTIQTKLRALRQTLTERNGLEATTRLLDVLGGEIDATRRAIDHTTSVQHRRWPGCSWSLRHGRRCKRPPT